MRQAGFLAAAGIYALDNNVERLKVNHERAQHIVRVLQGLASVKQVQPVETNIIIFEVAHGPADDCIAKLEQHGIKAAAFGRSAIRFVFHFDISDEMVRNLETSLTRHF